jgi:hypothetical protein
MKDFLAAALFVPALLAQAPEPTQNPVITFAKTHVDLGKIPADRKVTCRYSVTNTGKAYLNITRVEASCGCTYTMLGKWSLAPGESTEVEASFNPAGFRGVVRKNLTVTSNDPVNPRVTLSFEADVIQEIVPEPSVLFFQDLLRSASRKSAVRLKSGNGQPVQVKEVKTPGASYLSTSFRSDGNDVILEVAVDGQKLPAHKQTGTDSISVITTSERMRVVNINVQWDVKPVITATPERVGWVEAAGKMLRTAVILKHADGKPFRVTGAKPTHSAIHIEGLGKAGAAQQEIQVVLGPEAKAGTYQESVLLTLDDPDQPEYTLRVTAILR